MSTFFITCLAMTAHRGIPPSCGGTLTAAADPEADPASVKMPSRNSSPTKEETVLGASSV